MKQYYTIITALIINYQLIAITNYDFLNHEANLNLHHIFMKIHDLKQSMQEQCGLKPVILPLISQSDDCKLERLKIDLNDTMPLPKKNLVAEQIAQNKAMMATCKTTKADLIAALVNKRQELQNICLGDLAHLIQEKHAFSTQGLRRFIRSLDEHDKAKINLSLSSAQCKQYITQVN